MVNYNSIAYHVLCIINYKKRLIVYGILSSLFHQVGLQSNKSIKDDQYS